jgi:hypothetical protein
MCLMCEEEAFYQAYMAYLARKDAGAASEASAFKAEAVDADGDEASVAKEAVGHKVQST